MPRRRPVSKRAVAAALVGAVALPAGGCTDDSPPARPVDGRVAVTLDDFFISPQRIRARPGRITLNVVNRGRVGHTLRVRRGTRELLGIKTLLPGGTATAAGSLPAGEYELVCILGNHEELGMYGTLVVR